MAAPKEHYSDKSFQEIVSGISPALLKLDRLETLQVNLGNRCNQQCRHCHVQAGPRGNKIMTRGVMDSIVSFVKKHGDLTVDMTGGCPEMNPHFSYFMEGITEVVNHIIARTNLSVFLENDYDWVPKYYADHGVTIVASLPCYTQDNVDNQRGQGVFDKSIKAIRMLNKLGYGQEDNLELDLVYNPAGATLPPPQSDLEVDYKKHLINDHDIVFNKLFTITNAPIGRFRQILTEQDELDSYIAMLRENFNSEAAQQIMCRKLLSVDYRGIVYNCDFNQALGLPAIDGSGSVITMDNLESAMRGEIRIITGSHCFCCTAGAGSSCTGTLAGSKSGDA
ncbi:radical SAM/Cys-rich domain protein [Anaerohalosphaera lusitana]|uniref:Radical SAM/Cys-rich domain protein n=1 Tax=Anaerohalosphaera lusitana TaxID=1936003 RepID=A0A1U9NMV9_9BACT|nr:arsenosugar biosynthesis radical SAM (seleno)protein ArsS [Anaerohalosphaera lusitana]AQT69239.1 radical SAM/Cys-rich domain protein [Anaerohalosphaera lusitana]